MEKIFRPKRGKEYLEFKLTKKILRIFSVFVIISLFGSFKVPTYAYNNFTNNINEIDTINKENWWWTEIEIVSVNSSDHSERVVSAIDSENNLHVVWRDITDFGGSGSDQDIFYREYNTNTNSWSPVEVVSTESDGNGDYPGIAIDEQDNVHVVWSDTSDIDSSGTDADIFYKMKDSSTDQWPPVEVVSIGSIQSSYQPEIAVDSQGDVHTVWHDHHHYDGSDVDVIYRERDSYSNDWSPLTIISSESTDGSYSADIAVDSLDNIHVVWFDSTNDLYGSGIDTDVFYKKWEPITFWSSGFALSFESDSPSTRPQIVIDIDDNIHVAWTDHSDIYNAGTDSDIFYRYWGSSTFTWSPNIVISPESTALSNGISLDIDTNSNLYFTWIDYADMSGSGTDPDIFYRTLNINTNILSDYTLISDIATGNSYFPSVSVDSREHVHVIWYDDSSNLLGSGTDADEFYKRLVGPPEAPILADIFPSTRALGNLTLDWTPIIGADEYNIYKSDSFIWDVDGLVPIETTSASNFADEVVEAGIYYYTITANSIYGESESSNVVSVEILSEDSLESVPGLFENINWGEIIIIGGAVLAMQLIVSVITISVTAAKVPAKSSSKKGKK